MAIDPNDAAKWIQDFLAGKEGVVESIGPDQDLFAEAGLDSFGVISLITGLEARFGIRFSGSDLDDRRFSTIAGIAAIVSEASRRPLRA